MGVPDRFGMNILSKIVFKKINADLSPTLCKSVEDWLYRHLEIVQMDHIQDLKIFR